MKQVQSYNSVVMRGDFSIYEMRILLHIVRRAQPLYQGRKYADVLKRGVCTDGINMNFALPLADLLGRKSHNYEPLKQAIREMEREWHVEYYDSNKHIWHASTIIYNVSIEERAGMMRFSAPRWLIDYIADFRNGGYRIYDFETAMGLRNINAARLYLLMCSQEQARTIPIDELKKMLGVENKYKQTTDFVRRCIEPAKEELERKKANGFVYSLKREGDRPKGKVVAIIFKPIKREQRDRNISTQMEEMKSKVNDALMNYMSYQLHFTFKELNSNAKTLEAFCKIENWQVKFGDIVDRARRKRKNKGYIIAAMKHECELHGQL